MVKNYLKIALRNLIKNKGYTFINIFGLAMGLSSCILIFLFVRHEWSYDSFHKNKNSIYSIFIEETKPDGSVHFRRLIPFEILRDLVKDFPAVKNIAVFVSGDATLIHNGEAFREDIFEAHSTFFDVFTFPLLAGKSGKALVDPTNIVISEAIAKKYFGDDISSGYHEALGKKLSIQMTSGLQDFTVSAVMANYPNNSSIKADIVIPIMNYSNLPIGSNDADGRTSTYLLLDSNQDPGELEQALQPFTAIHFKNRIETYQARGLLAAGENALRLKLQPLRELHRNPEIPTNYEQAPHNPVYSYILSGIGVLVLLIGCINFTTLSIARSTSRAREVGMRKAVGALKKQLILQFWGEALLLSFLALILALLLTAQVLPLFNQLTAKALTLGTIGANGAFVLLGLTLIVGVISGGYPAFVLSRFQPAKVLKGDLKSGGASLFTRSLVGFQFTVSIALMVCASIIGQQVEFLKNKDLGYNDDQIIVFRARSAGSAQTFEKYRNALSAYPDVLFVVGAGQAFSRSEDTRLWKDANDNTRLAHVYGVDYDYVDMMEMHILEGRNFSRTFTADASTGVLVNETLAKEFGLIDPIGKKLTGFMPNIFDGGPTILGVVKDFHFKSLHQTIKPAILTIHPNYWARYRNVFVKIRPENIAATLDLLKAKWSEIAPNTPFNPFFLDQDVQKQYENEERWLTLMRYSTLLAMVIACMGLFGLSALLLNKRTKEIGIRKVLGASISNLLVLLSKDFARLVLLAFIIAAPLGYFVINRWLQDFAYRVDIEISTFLLVGGLAFLSVVLTISYQALKTALSNPVNSLRYE